MKTEIKNIALILITVMMISTIVNARIEIVKPNYYELQDGDIIELGEIMQGQEIELVFDKKTGRGTDWEDAIIEGEGNWTTTKQIWPDSIILKIQNPKIIENKEMKIKLISYERNESEEIIIKIKTRKDLIKSALDELLKETQETKKVEYELTIINETIAKEEIEITSNLPQHWMKTQKIELLPLQEKKIKLIIEPKIAGTRNFHINLKSTKTNYEQEFTATINNTTSIKQKMETTKYGLPIFNIGIAPMMYIETIIGMLLPPW